MFLFSLYFTGQHNPNVCMIYYKFTTQCLPYQQRENIFWIICMQQKKAITRPLIIILTPAMCPTTPTIQKQYLQIGSKTGHFS